MVTVPAPSGVRALVVGGTAWHVVAADVDPAWVAAQVASDPIEVPLGAHLFGTDFLDAALDWPTWTLETARRMFSAMGPWVLADAPRGSEQVRESVDPRLLDMLDRLALACRSYTGEGMPAELLTSIDRALAQAVKDPNDSAREDALIGLVGIRRGLFPDAPAYRPRGESVAA